MTTPELYKKKGRALNKCRGPGGREKTNRRKELRWDREMGAGRWTNGLTQYRTAFYVPKVVTLPLGFRARQLQPRQAKTDLCTIHHGGEGCREQKAYK